jgi:hypothetical protein
VKSGEEIVAYIDELMEFGMERPEMFALDVAMLENLFFALDDVRQFAIVDSKDRRDTVSRYGSYLGERGYGAMRFTTDPNALPIILTDETKESFRSFIKFWQGFLDWRDSR